MDKQIGTNAQQNIMNLIREIPTHAFINMDYSTDELEDMLREISQSKYCMIPLTRGT